MSRRPSHLLLPSLRGKVSAPVATLMTVAFLASFAPPRMAHAVENEQPADTPNFAEATNGVKGGAESAASTAKATKSRKAPVSAKGSFTHSIDIQVPPGRLGMTPSLSLQYDSSSVAESPVGVGWSFGPPTISRSTRLGFPRVTGPDNARTYDDAAAVFTGPSGELVPAADGPAGVTGKMYAPARETSAVRYEYRSAVDQFIEYDPSGKKRYYGLDPRLGRAGRIRNELGTSSWLLLREEDTHGNSISYRYHNDTEAARTNRKIAQRTPMLARVEWGSNSNEVPLTTGPFLVTTTMEAQAGPLNLLEGNTLLDHRIAKIDVSIDGAIKWSYALSYTISETGKSLLTRVKRTGDGPEDTIFSYSAGAPPSGPRFEAMGSLGGPTTANGVEVPLYTNWSAWGSMNPFAAARDTPEQAVQAPGFRPGTKFIDVDGNGTTDAIYHAAGIGTTATHILWEESALHIPSPGGGLFWQSPTGDGAAQAETGLPWFPLNGGWSTPNFATSVVQDLTDIDGDGDADTVSLPLSVKVLPGQGTAIFPPPPHTATQQLGEMTVRIATNSSRTAGGDHPASQVVKNWPPLVELSTNIFATPNGTFLDYKPEPESDVQLPIVDLNADGRSDVVLLKHRGKLRGYLQVGAALAIPHTAFMRIYGGMPAPELGEIDNEHLEEEIRSFTHVEHKLVLIDEDLLRPSTMPGQHVRLITSPERLGLPELAPGTPMVMLSATGAIGVPGIPSGPLPGPDPDDWQPTLPSEQPWWKPVVDPEGDVWLPLRDSWAIGGVGKGSVLLFGEHRFVPRVYLTRGTSVRGLISEPDENGSHFERSLQRVLNGGSAEECSLINTCAYPPHVNFNSFFADVNGDGLPDLISAEPPGQWADGSNQKPIVCKSGHRIQLNRGYAFEASPNETLANQDWANAALSTHPLTKVANRDRYCASPRPDIRDSFASVNPVQPGATMPTFPTAAMAQTDINGDGRIDIVLAYGPSATSTAVNQEIFLNNGRGFYSVSPSSFGLPPSIVLAQNIPYTGPVSTWPRVGLADLARFVDVDDDGLIDIVEGGLCYNNAFLSRPCKPAEWYRNRGTLPDRMTSVLGGDGAWTKIEYDSPHADSVHLTAQGIHPPASMRVVKLMDPLVCLLHSTRSGFHLKSRRVDAAA